MMPTCFDSWAVLAWLDGQEPAAARVESAVGRERPFISWVNLVEVHYRVARVHGAAEADRVLAELRRAVTEQLPGVSAMREVAALKAEHPIALADCFAVATASAGRATLLTGDPEIVERTAELPCEVSDLRPSR
jgi:predicted nucleic acid-binding protein